ncbi:diaminopimelate decarboxylase, partial [bacterium]|nr:diaminopimelate decarboxylase [bacterium]
MSASFAYRQQILGAQTSNGWQPLKDFLKSERPTYLYNSYSISERIAKMKTAFEVCKPQIHYAVKANSHAGILKLMKQQGLGVDVVSQGEAQIALEQGFSPQKIIFSGVAKSKSEIEFAIEKNIFQINVESLEELKRIAHIAQRMQKKVAVGIRINPNIPVDTHPYITTGFRENKFGISETQLEEVIAIAQAHPQYIHLQGLSSHIGSQIRDITPLTESLECLIKSSQKLLQQGFQLTTIDMGGGLGIDYFAEDESKEIQLIEVLGAKVSQLLKNNPLQLLLEPGRWLVARAGVLCAQVEYVKFNGYKNFIILNTGMNHLLRPALYKAHHRAALLTRRNENPQKIYDIVGPICESSDVLGQD